MYSFNTMMKNKKNVSTDLVYVYLVYTGKLNVVNYSIFL